jgi:hypothetical protein
MAARGLDADPAATALAGGSITDIEGAQRAGNRQHRLRRQARQIRGHDPGRSRSSYQQHGRGTPTALSRSPCAVKEDNWFNASGGDLGLQEGRRRMVEVVVGWLRRKPGHPGTIGPGQAAHVLRAETGRSGTRFVHGFVHETRRDDLRRGRPRGIRKTHAARAPRSARLSETARDGRDGRRTAHNPEVAGSNPAPATNFRRSRPFPSRERAFFLPSFVVNV